MRSPGSHPPFRGFPLSAAPPVPPRIVPRKKSIGPSMCGGSFVKPRPRSQQVFCCCGGKSLDRPRLIKILEDVKEGRLLPRRQAACFKTFRPRISGFLVDHHRAVRLGFPEVIFGQGKTVERMSRDFQKPSGPARHRADYSSR